MIVRFYNLTKRENSTLRPSGAYTEYECFLKSDTSVINPDILIDFADQQNPQPHVSFNYAYIPDFGRYYFIADQRSVSGLLWEYSLNCDVLATYKTQIGNYNFYILRSSNVFNGRVIDTYYPVLTQFTQTIKQLATPWPHETIDGAIPEYISVTKGCFIIGVVGIPQASGYGNYGSIKYLAVKYSQMNTLIQQLTDNTIISSNGFDVNDASLSLQKSLINPLSYIKSCQWVPFDYDDVTGTEMSTVTIWTWSLNIPCKLVTGLPMMFSRSEFTIDPHPQAQSRGWYLNASPYTQLELYYPPFGMISLDTMELIDTVKIRLEVSTDLITGAGRLEVWTDKNNLRTRLLHKLNTQIGVPIQLSEVGYDYSNVKASLIGIGAEAINSFASAVMPSGLSSAVSQIGNAANAMRTHVSSVGGNGNFSDLNGRIELIETYYSIAVEDINDVGRPLCEIRRPSDIPGFILIRNGDMPLPNGLLGEHDKIKAYLESGFYYE